MQLYNGRLHQTRGERKGNKEGKGGKDPSAFCGGLQGKPGVTSKKGAQHFRFPRFSGRENGTSVAVEKRHERIKRARCEEKQRKPSSDTLLS